MTAEKIKEKDIKYTVLILPTKEYAFSAIVAKSRKNFSETYNKLIENEQNILYEIKEYLSAQQIEFFDGSEELQQNILRGNQPYFTGTDGHPNEIGHKIIANFINNKLINQ